MGIHYITGQKQHNLKKKHVYNKWWNKWRMQIWVDLVILYIIKRFFNSIIFSSFSSELFQTNLLSLLSTSTLYSIIITLYTCNPNTIIVIQFIYLSSIIRNLYSILHPSIDDFSISTILQQIPCFNISLLHHFTNHSSFQESLQLFLQQVQFDHIASSLVFSTPYPELGDSIIITLQDIGILILYHLLI